MVSGKAAVDSEAEVEEEEEGKRNDFSKSHMEAVTQERDSGAQADSNHPRPGNEIVHRGYPRVEVTARQGSELAAEINVTNGTPEQNMHGEAGVVANEQKPLKSKSGLQKSRGRPYLKLQLYQERWMKLS